MRTERGTGIGIMIAAALAAGGCSQEVPDAHLPSVEPQLVVISHITPGQPVRVSVKKSEPLAYNITLTEQGHTPTITDARVAIRCMATGAERAVPFLDVRERYRLEAADFPIRRGHTYRLDVSYGGLPPVTATVTVPEGIPRISGPQLVLVHSPDPSDDGQTLQLVGAIHDPPGEEHYYRIAFGVSDTTLITTDLYGEPLPDPSYYYELIHEHFEYQSLSDFGRDGETIGFGFEGFANIPPVEQQAFERQVRIRVADHHYARFRRAFDVIMDAWENPLREPMSLPTNIQGGLGLFSAYLDTILVVRLTP